MGFVFGFAFATFFLCHFSSACPFWFSYTPGHDSSGACPHYGNKQPWGTWADSPLPILCKKLDWRRSLRKTALSKLKSYKGVRRLIINFYLLSQVEDQCTQVIIFSCDLIVLRIGLGLSLAVIRSSGIESVMEHCGKSVSTSVAKMYG